MQPHEKHKHGESLEKKLTVVDAFPRSDATLTVAVNSRELGLNT